MVKTTPAHSTLQQKKQKVTPNGDDKEEFDDQLQFVENLNRQYDDGMQ